MRQPVRHRAEFVFVAVTCVAVNAGRPRIRIVRLALVTVIIQPGHPDPGHIKLQLYHRYPGLFARQRTVPVQAITFPPEPDVSVTRHSARIKSIQACDQRVV